MRALDLRSFLCFEWPSDRGPLIHSGYLSFWMLFIFPGVMISLCSFVNDFSTWIEPTLPHVFVSRQRGKRPRSLPALHSVLIS